MDTETPQFEPPILRRTLHEEVVTRLRDMIIDGTLESGARVNESELGPRLGVSRTPLREALRTLASEGLIELVPSKGAQVRRFGLDEVAEMLEALKAIEGYAARLGAVRGSDSEIEAILALHAEMTGFYRSGERLAYYKLNQKIHSAVVALAHNRSLAELHGHVQGQLKRIRYVGNGGATKWAGAMEEHERIARGPRPPRRRSARRPDGGAHGQHPDAGARRSVDRPDPRRRGGWQPKGRGPPPIAGAPPFAGA